MNTPDSTPDLIKNLWSRYEARAWDAARPLFAPTARMRWIATNEQFDGRDAIIAVNATYPEGWTITLLDHGLLADGRGFSIVQVDHAPHRFFATSFFRIEAGLICELDEYWATQEAPPAWRTASGLGRPISAA